MKNRNLPVDDNWATPFLLYNRLNDQYKFDFDPCPYNELPITDETDGLKANWGKMNFVNPPYSRLIKEAFIMKSISEMEKGNTSVMLIPTSTSTNIFHDYIKPNAESIDFVRGRVRFLKRNKETGEFTAPPNNGMHDSMIIVFRRKQNDN